MLPINDKTNLTFKKFNQLKMHLQIRIYYYICLCLQKCNYKIVNFYNISFIKLYL